VIAILFSLSWLHAAQFFAWYKMHQPAGLTWPSTTWQDVGDCHSAQFWHRCPDFGTGW